MTAQYRDSRRYDGTRERVFQACHDAMQPCGFTIKSSQPDTFTIEAEYQYRESPGANAGLFEEFASLAFDKLLSGRFGESITLTVDEDSRVHAVSISRPKTTLLDQGKNRENILAIWKKMDSYLLHSPTVVNDHSVTIGNNSGVVQNDSVGDVRQTNDFRGGAEDRPRTAADPESRDEAGRWEIGIITVLSEETKAVIYALGLHGRRIGGLHFYEGGSDAGGAPVRVVATRALAQGNRSAMAAYENLRRHYDPRIVVLVGIGGAIRTEVALGDVVVADRIVYYDLRKETGEGTRHRGEERAAPSEVGHAVNAFFTANDPASFSVEDPGGAVHEMRIWPGLIGSGDAVIADHEAEILEYLAGFNDKILAVDMESGGLTAACHEQSASSGQLQGWLVIRGISDDAGPGKNDDYHRLASWHAATALRKILPYLAPPP
jgi:adenosylhomocysteine nucleosidase